MARSFQLSAKPHLKAAVGALYWFVLRKYDINYYLTQRPPEFKAVVAIAGLLMTVMALWIIIWIAGWLLALPMVLFNPDFPDGLLAMA